MEEREYFGLSVTGENHSVSPSFEKIRMTYFDPVLLLDVYKPSIIRKSSIGVCVQTRVVLYT